MLKRQEIIAEVHSPENLRFFRKAWCDFCGKVEDYGRKLNDLISKAQAKYDHQHIENRPQVEAAIAEAHQQLGPALDLLSRARTQYEKTAARLNAGAKRVAHAADSLLKRLPRTDHLSVTPPASIVQIEAKAQNALRRRRDRADGLWRTLLDAKERYEAVQRRTDQLHYSAVTATKKSGPPGEGYVWTLGMGEMYGSVYRFVRVPIHSPFWRPAELVNPTSWFGLTYACQQVDLSPDDQILHDAIVLAVAHDDVFKGKGAVPCIYRRGTYGKEGWFCADDFIDALAERLRQPDADCELSAAWDGVQPALRRNEAGPGTTSKTQPAAVRLVTLAGTGPVDLCEAARAALTDLANASHVLADTLTEVAPSAPTVEKTARELRHYAESITPNAAQSDDEPSFARNYSGRIGGIGKDFHDVLTGLRKVQSPLADQAEKEWNTFTSAAERLDLLVAELSGPKENPAAQQAFEQLVEEERQHSRMLMEEMVSRVNMWAASPQIVSRFRDQCLYFDAEVVQRGDRIVHHLEGLRDQTWGKASTAVSAPLGLVWHKEGTCWILRPAAFAIPIPHPLEWLHLPRTGPYGPLVESCYGEDSLPYLPDSDALSASYVLMAIFHAWVMRGNPRVRPLFDGIWTDEDGGWISAVRQRIVEGQGDKAVLCWLDGASWSVEADLQGAVNETKPTETTPSTPAENVAPVMQTLNEMRLPEYTKAMTAGDASQLLGLSQKVFRQRFTAKLIRGERVGKKYRVHISEFPAEVLAKLRLSEMTK